MLMKWSATRGKYRSTVNVLLCIRKSVLGTGRNDLPRITASVHSTLWRNQIAAVNQRIYHLLDPILAVLDNDTAGWRLSVKTKSVTVSCKI